MLSIALAGNEPLTVAWRGARTTSLRTWRTAGCAAVSGVLFGLAAWRWQAPWELAVHLGLFAVLVVLCVIDVEHYRLPDRVTFPAMGATVVVVALASVSAGTATPALRATAGAALLWGGLGIAHLVSPRGMGRGDVKLGVTLGAFLGWAAPSGLAVVSLVLAAVFAASVIGTIIGLVVLVQRRHSAPYPFGPALAAGAVLVLLTSPHLVG